MFLRRKPNKSGTVSVQVVEKRDGKYIVLQSFGAARDKEAVERLVTQANKWISDRRGSQLPFSFERDEIVESFVGGLTNGQLQVIGPELVYGALYDHIGYDRLNNDLFRHVVICRLFNPGSKLKTVDYLERYLHVKVTADRIYRMLDNLVGDCAGGMKQEVEQISFDYTRKVVGEKITIVFYDMTTLYFEASDEDDLRRCGFSKDGKHSCPQIFLGLLVTTGGNPIGYEIFEGNIFEGHTLIPVIEKLASRFGFDHPIVVADAGLLSKKNLDLEKMHYKYILGARPKNEPQKIKDKILGFKLGYGDVRVIRRDKTTRLIVSMSEKRAAKDARNRRLGLARLEKRLGSGKLTKSSINNKGYNRYLEMEGDVKIKINYEKFHADASWDGIKVYVTNTSMPKQKILAGYSNLWFIERAFRMNKTDLRIRPIYHRLRNRIEGHICICFTAYTVMLELERRLKDAGVDITLERAKEITKTMYRLTFRLPDSKEERSVILGMTPEQQRLVELTQN